MRPEKPAAAASISTTSRSRAGRGRSSRDSATATGPGSTTTPTAHEIHSVFAWDAGKRAYAVLVDNRESRNVDIVDISNPRRPSIIAEYDLASQFPQIPQERPANLVDVFHHDVVVKKVGARQVMLVSYWDGGYVKLDVTNPKRARYLADSDFASIDPELAAQASCVSRRRATAISRS